MKLTKSMIIKETDESNELTLCTVNESRLYPWICDVINNLHRKYVKGIFDAEKAIQAFYPIATESAKLYCKEFCSRNTAFNSVFDVTARYTTAYDCVNYYMDDIKTGV